MAALDGLARITMLGHSASNQVSSNTVHISNDGAGAPPDFNELADLAEQWADQFDTTYRGMGHTTWTWDQVVAKQVIPPGDTTVALEAAFAVAAAGTRTGASPYLPEAICGCLALKTPNASRRFRGHILLPPALVQTSVSGNNFNPSEPYWTAMGALGTELAKGTPGGSGWTGSALANYNLVVYSSTAQGLSLPSVANVQTLVPRAKVSWLRRREQGAT